MGVPHCKLAHTGFGPRAGSAPSVIVQVLPDGMLGTVWVGELMVRFKFTLMPEVHETLTGNAVASGRTTEVRFVIVLVTVNEPVQLSGSVTAPCDVY